MINFGIPFKMLIDFNGSGTYRADKYYFYKYNFTTFLPSPSLSFSLSLSVFIAYLYSMPQCILTRHSEYAGCDYVLHVIQNYCLARNVGERTHGDRNSLELNMTPK